MYFAFFLLLTLKPGTARRLLLPASPRTSSSSCWNISSSSIFRLAGLDLWPAPNQLPRFLSVMNSSVCSPPSSISIIHQTNPCWFPPTEHTFTRGFPLLENTPAYASQLLRSLGYLLAFVRWGVGNQSVERSYNQELRRSAATRIAGFASLCNRFRRPEVKGQPSFLQNAKIRRQKWRRRLSRMEELRLTAAGGNFILHVYSILQIIDTLISQCLKRYETSGRCLRWEE